MNGAVAAMETSLASIVGEERVVTNASACAAFAIAGMAPKSVVYPTSAEQVAEVLRAAASAGLTVVPCRSGTKLDRCMPGPRYDVALCLKDMNRVWYYEPGDLVASVEPGMKFCSLQRFLDRDKLWVPLDPPCGARASVGGILAASTAGPLRLRFGGPRDMVLGLKIATVEGKVIKTGGRVVKNVAGYDLAKLLIGSWGTLGVIVEATFKLYPQPGERTAWVVSPRSLAAARAFRRKLLLSPLRPLRMTLARGAALSDQPSAVSKQPASAVARVSSPAAFPDSDQEIGGLELWIEAAGSERVLDRYEKELRALANSIEAPIRKMETEVAAPVWDRIADAANWMASDQHARLVVRAALPIAASEEFIERAEGFAGEVECQALSIAQTGVGVVEIGFVERGSPTIIASDRGVALIAKLIDTARNLGGRLTIAKRPVGLPPLVEVWDPPGDDFEVMRKLKEVWNPKGTLAGMTEWGIDSPKELLKRWRSQAESLKD